MSVDLVYVTKQALARQFCRIRVANHLRGGYRLGNRKTNMQFLRIEPFYIAPVCVIVVVSGPYT